MNAISLIATVAGRIWSYDPSEYLREINAAYKETWDYILQLDDSYFTDIKTLTVGTQNSEFDFLYNSNGALTGTGLSPRFFQVDRIRVLQAGQNSWYSAVPQPWNDPQRLSIERNTPAVAQTYPPYVYTLIANGEVRFAAPLPAGTQLEVTYSYSYLPLTYVTAGTVALTSASATVTGTGTQFTQVVGPDYQTALPGNNEDTDIGLELILNYTSAVALPTPNNVYRIKSVASDTAATLLTSSLVTGGPLQAALAMVPDIPLGHHNVISTIATRNFMSTPGDDKRSGFWAAMAEKELDSMRDSIMTRQRQAPARRGRFPMGVRRVSSSASR